MLKCKWMSGMVFVAVLFSASGQTAAAPTPKVISKTASGTTFRLEYYRQLNKGTPLLLLQIMNPGTPRPLTVNQLLVALYGYGIDTTTGIPFTHQKVKIQVNIEPVSPGIYRLKTRLPRRGNWELVVTQLTPPRKEVRFAIAAH